MTRRLSDAERLDEADRVVAAALAALRDGDTAEANQLLAHAVHAGVQPAELVAEVVAQTGGRL